ncbi:MAG: 2-amino-4-hydroxy-6-hydroxymethyldihydropteridine diphosphokinase [Bacteroidia bacterium]|nr:2-amino-4-hydroxy-6-hydroxymethyldihydropteridine diphosphokinase [Bacteroidia bacterium]NND10664.1 2-amino-4-hydroxy-6-hydroxymethyldihydropteridine diphosphokinase [Flavobacteriaceae bacterium]NNK28684.1 2-amino-4-hydroxy-6-hydroxymethyldihydropteridine diphosphokinase [Flavobacteriaceae bacterium]
MMQLKKVYLSLGSNKGDKFKNLQDAVNEIYQCIGNVKLISKVYQSPSMGFKSDDFLNTCLIVETTLTPTRTIKEILKVEKRLGRERSGKGYAARTIDIDILFYEDRKVSTKTLEIPHPEMQNRQFVLWPLNDIAADVMHPRINKSVSELLVECTDSSQVEPIRIWLKNPRKKHCFTKFNYLAIEGNIGAGKTSLATMISMDFNAKLILERFADNPFLPKFYEDQTRYAFPLEMSFLADRYQQISDDLSQLDLFKDFIVSDYDVFKSLIFSKITLQEDEFKLYRKLFYLMHKDLAKPDLYVYLYQNTERLQENIKSRGRKYEQEIDTEYLEKINAGYIEFLRNQTGFNVQLIDISDMDFVKNRHDYLKILDKMCDYSDK